MELSENGVAEAHQAARLLGKHEIMPDWCCTSYLKRSIHTLWIVLQDLDCMWLPVDKDWRLNERHYGALQGLNKAETAEKVGDEQVHTWRRSFSVRPPALDEDDVRFPGHDRRYASLFRDELPRSESLEDTISRFMPYWHEKMAPQLRAGKVVLSAAHGNSLRALVKYLDQISDDDIPGLEIPTGVPLLYQLDDSLRPLESYYLE